MEENTPINNNNEPEISIREIFELVLNNWFWFAISITTCLIIAFMYSKTVNKTYKAETLIIIKTDSKKSGLMSESAIFEDMGLGGTNTIIENEVFVLSSTSLINKAVKRLNSNISYIVKPFLREVDIYNNSPIKIALYTKNDLFNYHVIIKNINNNTYNYCITKDKEILEEGIGEYEKKIITSTGEFAINKTPLYKTEWEYEEIVIKIANIKNTTKSIKNRLSVARTDKVTDVLKINLTSSNVKRAKDFLNTLITIYNEDVISDKNKVATNTENFIVERIANISKDLGGIDSQIEQLKKDNKIIDFQSTSNNLVILDANFKKDIIDVETEISLVKFIKNYLSNPENKDGLIPSNIGINDIGIEGQINKYNEERIKLDKILINAGANNPITKELQNTLTVTKINMLSSIDNYLSTLNIKHSQLKEHENIANRRIENVPTQEKLITDIIRQQKIKETLYLYLLNKREENALNLAITESSAKIIEEPDGSSNPIAPRTIIFLFIAIIIGASIPAGFILLVNILDSKIHNRQDIEKYTTIPSLGEIPRKQKSIEKEEIVIKEDGVDKICESFRIARSNLEFFVDLKKKGATIIQSVSTTAGEGKTFVTTNLALSYAHIGKKVLIMDLDLHKGKMTKILDSKRHMGISNYLSGKTDNYHDVIKKSVHHPNLDLIPTGAIPPNPASLLMSKKFENLISELKKDYDYIFIDSLPALVVADATIINRIVDITLYIVRNNKIEKRYLPEIEKLFKSNRFKNMTILVSDVDTENERFRYNYNYGYRYAYNYGYRYGADEKDDE